MAQVPGWKIKRELGRLGQQLSAIPEAIWEPLAQARHDRSVLRLPVFEGAHGEAPKVAIVLIFQPRGLPESVFRMIEHVATAGYSVLAVSNTPLSGGDREKIGTHVWRWIERPNFGYDFGGYRDGIRLLQSWHTRPERLAILNDSTWFPLVDGDDTLAQLEALNADVAGSVLTRRNARATFLESYIYSVPGRILEAPAFQQFWEDFRITSNKHKTIRRGERGFSQAMLQGGHGIAPLFSRERFDSMLNDLGLEELANATRFAAVVEPQIEARRKATMGSSDRSLHLEFIRDVMDRAHFHCSFPVISHGVAGYPFLKKTRDKSMALWRQRYVEAVEADILKPPADCIWSEVVARVRGE